VGYERRWLGPAFLIDGYDGEWSPDGERIAFINDVYDPTVDDYLGNVMIANADGTGITQLTTSGHHHESSPSWSSDGEFLAVRSQEWIVNPAIYVVDAQTGKFHTVTGTGDHSEEWTPAWQPTP
jgi:Tol biopolymer transport system component